MNTKAWGPDDYPTASPVIHDGDRIKITRDGETGTDVVVSGGTPEGAIMLVDSGYSLTLRPVDSPTTRVQIINHGDEEWHDLGVIDDDH